MKLGIIIIGKLPPPFFGPAIATKIILDSNLKEEFDLKHVNTKINESIQTMGSFQLKKIVQLFRIYFQFIKYCFHYKNKVILLPIAQETSAIYKDLIFIIISKLFFKKVILHLRGSNLRNWFENTAKINQIVSKFWFSRCEAAIVLGNNLKYIFEPFLSEDKIYVIPNGGNYIFPPKQNSEKIEILYFANLMHNKGVDLLIDAIISLTKEKKAKIHCNVIGTWETISFKQKCEQKVNEFKLPITFHAAVGGEVKFQFFSNASIFVFTPRKPEGHPWVIVEAMAAGLPIISSNQGAIIESVLDNHNGYIVSTENEENLVEKLNEFIEKPNLIEQMGNKSFELYQANFTEEIMIAKLKNLFLTILK